MWNLVLLFFLIKSTLKEKLLGFSGDSKGIRDIWGAVEIKTARNTFSSCRHFFVFTTSHWAELPVLNKSRSTDDKPKSVERKKSCQILNANLKYCINCFTWLPSFGRMKMNLKKIMDKTGKERNRAAICWNKHTKCKCVNIPPRNEKKESQTTIIFLCFLVVSLKKWSNQSMGIEEK